MSNKVKQSPWEWVLSMVFFRAPMALALGLVLEGLTMFFGSVLFGNMQWWNVLTNHDSHISTAISFVVFHIIGWVIMLHQWGYYSGEKIDPSAPSCARNEFRFEQGNYVVTGRILKK